MQHMANNLRGLQFESSNGTRICHTTDGPPTSGLAGPFTANFVVIDCLARPCVAAMDGPAGLFATS